MIATATSSEWICSSRGTEFRWRREQAGIRAEWVGILALLIHPDGRVETRPAPDADPLVVDKLLHTGAAAFMRALRGRPSLHGSAVARGGRALVCLGESGAGKSTAAAELCRRHGFELLADDAVGLERVDSQWLVLPTESSHWLVPESTPTSPKTRVPAGSAATGTAVLSQLVLLRVDPNADSPSPRRLRGLAAYCALRDAALRFERTAAASQSELEVLASLARQASVYELARHHSSPSARTAGALAALGTGSR